MKRRHVLKMIGGGVIASAATGAVWTATRTPTVALAPWAAAGGASYTEPRMKALSYAILAPNPHNRQPWLVDMEGDDGFALYFDTTRQLPETDPFDRQLCIGLGCFLELMKMAADSDGQSVTIELFPNGEDATGLGTSTVARVRFAQDDTVQADPLWAYVRDRRSNKEPFDTLRPVPEEKLSAILRTARWGGEIGGSVQEDDIAYWRVLTSKALRIEVETPHTFKESVDLFRIGKREVVANPDGIDFTGPIFEAMGAMGLFSRQSALDPASIGYQEGLRAVLENTETAMGHVWMTTAGNTRVDQIMAGRDWLRFNLAVAREGLAFQPLSQALQEYPEMAELYKEVHQRLAPNGGTVQMLGRIGYGPTVPVSPRWPIEEKVQTV